MYQLSCHVTILNTKQGYPFILRMLQDMFEPLIVISWSVSYASSQQFVDSQSFGWVSEVGNAPQYSHPWYLDIPDTTLPMSMPSKGATQHHTSLGWQEDCLGNTPTLTDKWTILLHPWVYWRAEAWTICGYHACVLAKVIKGGHGLLQMVKHVGEHPAL